MDSCWIIIRRKQFLPFTLLLGPFPKGLSNQLKNYGFKDVWSMNDMPNIGQPTLPSYSLGYTCDNKRGSCYKKSTQLLTNPINSITLMAPLGSHIVTIYPSFLFFRLYLWLVHTNPINSITPMVPLGSHIIKFKVKLSTPPQVKPMTLWALAFGPNFAKMRLRNFQFLKILHFLSSS